MGLLKRQSIRVGGWGFLLVVLGLFVRFCAPRGAAMPAFGPEEDTRTLPGPTTPD